MSRETILRAAAQIFQEKGYHAASMQDIAEAVDLQKGSLYHHVKGKQEILLALLDEALVMILARLEGAISPENPPSQNLKQLMRAYLGFLAENRSLSSVLLLEYRSLEAEYKDTHIPHRDRVEAIWIQVLEDGIKRGEFQVEKPGLASKALLGVLNWTITWYREDGPLTTNQIADQFTELFQKGLLLRD
jgi:AcrR family transcriptional regulator